jgi:hypothetical protein
MLNIIFTQGRGNFQGSAKTSVKPMFQYTQPLLMRLLAIVIGCFHLTTARDCKELNIQNYKQNLGGFLSPPEDGSNKMVQHKLPNFLLISHEIPLYPNTSISWYTVRFAAQNVLIAAGKPPIRLICSQNFYATKFVSSNWGIVSRPTAEGQGSVVANSEMLMGNSTASYSKKVGFYNLLDQDQGAKQRGAQKLQFTNRII